jgi:hypothetical protein
LNISHAGLLNVTDLTQLGGTATVVFVITCAARHALDWNPRWFGLLLSIFVAGMECLATYSTWQSVLLVIPNGCLIYTTAVGINSMTGLPVRKKKLLRTLPEENDGMPRDVHILSQQQSFLAPWY